MMTETMVVERVTGTACLSFSSSVHHWEEQGGMAAEKERRHCLLICVNGEKARNRNA